MTTDASNAYADVITALAGARPTAASEAFDRALSAAVAAGVIDPQASRALRFWQRASVQEVVDHLTAVVPRVMQALDESAAQAKAAAEAADASWRAAGGIDLTDRPGESEQERRRRLVLAGLTGEGDSDDGAAAAT